MSAELLEANNLQQQITGTRFYKKKEAQKREKKNRERERGDKRLGKYNNEINRIAI